MSCFLPTRASDPRIQHLNTSRSLIPILNNSPFVPYSNIETPPNPYTHAHTHPYPLQPGHISMRGTKMKFKLFFKCRPTGQIRWSNLRVNKKNDLAGQGDPTRITPVSPGSIGRCRVGSTVSKFCRVGWGQEAFKNSRVGSGQVTIPQCI